MKAALGLFFLAAFAGAAKFKPEDRPALKYFKDWKNWDLSKSTKQQLPSFTTPNVQKNFARAARACPEGTTGPLCQYPVCKTMGHAPPWNGNGGGFGQLIDAEFYGVCDGVQYFPVDAYIQQAIYISLDTTDNGSPPTIMLKDPQGNEVSGTTISQDNYHVWIEFLNVSPGDYSIVYKAKDTCSIIITAPTDLTVTPGFVKTAQDDNARLDLPEYMPHVFVGSLNSMCTPGELQGLQVYRTSNVVYTSSAMKRYGCAYESHFGKITCDSEQQYYYKFYGSDDYGNTFVRLDILYCVKSSITTPHTPTPSTTTTPNDGHYCQHGGTPTPEGHCFCQPYYTGFYCESAMCANGGTNVKNACFCPIGYTGQFCEHIQCGTEQQDFNTDHRALNFIFMNRFTMTQDKQQVVDAATNISKYYQNAHPGYFIDWTLTTFSDRSGVDTKFFTNEDDFMKALHAIEFDDTINCPQPVLEAIQSTFAYAIVPRSPVFIFTDSVASDHGREYDLMKYAAFWRKELFFVVSDPTGTKETNSKGEKINCPLDTTAPGFTIYNKLAQYTHGHVLMLQKAEIAEVMMALAPTLYKMNTLLLGDFENCHSQDPMTPLFVEKDTTEIYVTATGKQLQLELTSPSGQVMSVQPKYTKNDLFIFHMNQRPFEAGAYLMKFYSGMTPASMCTYRVLGRSNYDLFVGYSTNLLSDSDSFMPSYLVSSHLVAHITNHKVIDQSTLDTEVVTYINRNDKREYLYMSTGRYRDECNYHLYYGEFACQEDNQVFYVTVYADDNEGYTFQRSTTGYCHKQPLVTTHAPPMTTTPTAPGTCLNGGVFTQGHCICPLHYMGAFCQDLRCENNGTAVNGQCQCPTEFGGEFCHLLTCHITGGATHSPPTKDFEPTGRSLAFVIDTTILMAMDMASLHSYMDQLTQEMNEQHPNWFTKYILVTFDEKNYQMVMTSTSMIDFAAAVKNINASESVPDQCETMSLQAIKMALQNSYMYGQVFVFTDSAANGNVSDAGAIFDLTNMMRTEVNFFVTEVSPCQQHFDQFGTRIYIDIADFTGGTAYILSKNYVKKALSIIPTRFQSSMVSWEVIKDCDNKNTTLYIPVDSMTSSVNIFTMAHMADVTVMSPDGRAYNALNVVHDENMMRVDQIIQPCQSGWDTRDAYCYQFVPKLMNWVDARQHCHEQGARLATILSQEEQAYLDRETAGVDYWSGLNDITNEGTWMWDNVHQPQPLGSYANWGQGEPSQNDRTRNCVEVHAANGDKGEWFTADCSLPKAFICEQHRYDPDHFAKTRVEPGLWQVTVSAKPMPSMPYMDGMCYVKVRAQSRMEMYSGFVQDPRQDIPNAEPFISSAMDNRMIAQVTNKMPGFDMQFLHMYYMDNTMFQSVPMKMRMPVDDGKAACAYSFVSEPFDCPSAQGHEMDHGHFKMVARGMDEQGHLFQRLTTAICVKNTGTTTSGPTDTTATPTGTTPTVKPGECMHGGIMYQGACVCTQFWTGAHCERAICMNGGTNNQQGTCDCKQPFVGDHCAVASCQNSAPPPTKPNFNFLDKSLVIVLDLTYSMEYVVDSQIKPMMLNWLVNLDNYQAGWFLNYILVPLYDPPNHNGPVVGDIVVTQDKTAFANAINATKATNGQECPNHLMEGVLAGLKRPELQPDSFVMVFTQAVAKDYAMKSMVMDMISKTGAQVNFVVTGSDNPCGTGFEGPMVDAMREVAEASRGNLYAVPAQEVHPFMNMFMPTEYMSSILAQTPNSRIECTNQDLYFPVDYHMKEITIDIFGLYPRYKIYDMNGMEQGAEGTILHGKYNDLITVKPNNNWGMWRVRVSTNGGPCLVQIRGKSPAEVYLAYTTGNEGSQNTMNMPMGDGMMNRLLVHNTDEERGSRLEYAEWYDPVSWEMVAASPLHYREMCDYHYYSEPFMCNPAMPNTYLAISGRDAMNMPFRRIQTMHCPSKMGTTTMPMTTPNPPTCDLKKSMLDVVLAVDSSAMMGPTHFNEVKAFLRQFVTEFTMGSMHDETQVALMTVGDKALVFADFHTYNNTQQLQHAIDGLHYFGDNGQNLHEAFNATLNLLVPNHGFRPPADKHLLIYLTSRSWTGADPMMMANTLRNHNVNIVGVGYGQDAEMMQQLKRLSGENCVGQAMTPSDMMMKVMPFLKAKICDPNHMFCNVQ